MQFKLNALVHEEKRARDGFKKLRKLLGDIKLLVLKHGTMKISLVCKGKKLSVHQRPDSESCLPKDELALFGSAA